MPILDLSHVNLNLQQQATPLDTQLQPVQGQTIADAVMKPTQDFLQAFAKARATTIDIQDDAQASTLANSFQLDMSKKLDDASNLEGEKAQMAFEQLPDQLAESREHFTQQNLNKRQEFLFKQKTKEMEQGVLLRANSIQAQKAMKDRLDAMAEAEKNKINDTALFYGSPLWNSKVDELKQLVQSNMQTRGYIDKDKVLNAQRDATTKLMQAVVTGDIENKNYGRALQVLNDRQTDIDGIVRIQLLNKIKASQIQDAEQARREQRENARFMFTQHLNAFNNFSELGDREHAQSELKEVVRYGSALGLTQDILFSHAEKGAKKDFDTNKKQAAEYNQAGATGLAQKTIQSGVEYAIKNGVPVSTIQGTATNIIADGIYKNLESASNLANQGKIEDASNLLQTANQSLKDLGISEFIADKKTAEKYEQIVEQLDKQALTLDSTGDRGNAVAFREVASKLRAIIKTPSAVVMARYKEGEQKRSAQILKDGGLSDAQKLDIYQDTYSRHFDDNLKQLKTEFQNNYHRPPTDEEAKVLEQQASKQADIDAQKSADTASKLEYQSATFEGQQVNSFIQQALKLEDERGNNLFSQATSTQEFQENISRLYPELWSNFSNSPKNIQEKVGDYLKANIDNKNLGNTESFNSLQKDKNIVKNFKTEDDLMMYMQEMHFSPNQMKSTLTFYNMTKRNAVAQSVDDAKRIFLNQIAKEEYDSEYKDLDATQQLRVNAMADERAVKFYDIANKNNFDLSTNIGWVKTQAQYALSASQQQISKDDQKTLLENLQSARETVESATEEQKEYLDAHFKSQDTNAILDMSNAIDSLSNYTYRYTDSNGKKKEREIAVSARIVDFVNNNYDTVKMNSDMTEQFYCKTQLLDNWYSENFDKTIESQKDYEEANRLYKQYNKE